MYKNDTSSTFSSDLFFDNAIAALREHMFNHGHTSQPDVFEPDGAWHRYHDSTGKKSNMDASYRMTYEFGESLRCSYGTFRDKSRCSYFEFGEKTGFFERWRAMETAKDTHPYIVRKKINEKYLAVIKQEEDRLYLPVFNRENECCGLHWITNDDKRNVKHTVAAGGRLRIHDNETDDSIVYVCEGVSTGLSIHEATKNVVMIAFSAGNLKAVGKICAEEYPGSRIVFAADNDLGKGFNTGLDAAQKAAKSIGAEVAIPNTPDGIKCDWNDIFCWYGSDEVKRQLHIKSNAQSILSKSVDVRKFIINVPEQQKYLFDERMPAGRGVVITGVGGSSKTRILYHLAIGAITGKLPWSWDVSRTGKAVLILTEDTSEDVHRTLFSIARAANISSDELSESLKIIPLAGNQYILLRKTATGTLERTQEFTSLVEELKALGDVVFVGIDPALSISEGDEMDQTHQRANGKMIDDMAIQTGATCALVAHATKASMQAVELQSHNSRGGGALTDAVRAEYAMRNMTLAEAQKAKIDDIEERKRLVQFVCTKSNGLPPSAYVPMWLRRDDDGSLSEADVSLSDVTLTSNDKKVLDVLVRLSKTSPCSLNDWRNACVEEGLIHGASDISIKKTMERIRKKLTTAGCIEKGIGKGVWKIADF